MIKTLSQLFVGAVLMFSVTANASKSMDQIVENYLKIQDALASDVQTGIPQAAGEIKKLTGQLKGSEKALAKNLSVGATEVAKGSDIKQTREAFKKLSAPMVAWAKQSKPADLEIYSCSMAQAPWLQKKGTSLRNPYYGKEMLECGEKEA